MWARVVGAPYTSDYGNKEWSLEAKLDQKAKTYLLDLGIPADKIKFNEKGKYDFLRFKRAAVKRDGSDAAPIAIVDDQVQPWDQNKLIGNGSKAKVRFALNTRRDPRSGKEILVPSVVAIQVLEHVPYSGSGGFKPVERTGGHEESWEDA